jgi:hypothetical protein
MNDPTKTVPPLRSFVRALVILVLSYVFGHHCITIIRNSPDPSLVVYVAHTFFYIMFTMSLVWFYLVGIIWVTTKRRR